MEGEGSKWGLIGIDRFPKVGRAFVVTGVVAFWVPLGAMFAGVFRPWMVAGFPLGFVALVLGAVFGGFEVLE